VNVLIDSRRILQAAALTAMFLAQGIAPYALPAEVQPVRVTLVDTAQVRAPIITLADLLPPDAPDAMHDRAKGILLGNSPSTGSQRVFTRDAILRAARNYPELASQLAVPSQVVITRWSRLLTRREIKKALEKSMTANGFPGSKPLAEKDVTFTTPVVVTEDAPRLSVMFYEPQRDRATTRVALWTVSEPRNPPFWVTVNRDLDPSSDSALAPAHTNETAASKPVAVAASIANVKTARVRNMSDAPPRIALAAQAPLPTQNAELLVHAGKAIQLIVQGTGMRITANATALETGSEGQQVRVQCQPAGKILIAKVVAESTAEIDY
jgi:flagella basal body P-ring formation protein FlgA